MPLNLWLILIITVYNLSAQQNVVSIHHAAQLEHHNHPTSTKLVGNQNTPRSLPNARMASRNPVVFGFLPYWIDDSYFEFLNFNLLTHIAPFSIEINPDGSVSNDHNWPWTALIDRAHNHGVRVILTATLFGDYEVKTLLENDVNRYRFIKQITEKIRVGNADGVIVDFEGAGANGWPKLLPNFLQELTRHVHTEIPGSEVSFASPAIDWNNHWDFLDIADSCDYLFIMGYAFAGSWSERTGSTAPISGGSRNLNSLLEDPRDYGEVVQKKRDKLILGVPYYGCRWQTATEQPQSSIEEFINYPRLKDAIPQSLDYTLSWDQASKTPWYAYEKDQKWMQVWFENSESLLAKYKLAKDTDLLGIGIWALGYEGGEKEPWQVIENFFGRRDITNISTPDSESEPFAVDLPYPNPFNSTSRIYYSIPSAGDIKITLYNLLGQQIRSANINHTRAGKYKWDWDGKNSSHQYSASGLHLLKIRYTDDPFGSRKSVVNRHLLLLR
ncbi:MAG: glycosyl hydrolase family 18 protein [Candidatus Latescibacterota bacterium]|nr:glycosyl hydrolase family 18 protein [Candidatus Latescibacterota bacterium]